MPKFMNGFHVSALILLSCISACSGGRQACCQQPESSAISSYEQCVAAGYPVLKSLPPQCRTGDGRIFVQSTGALAPDSVEAELLETEPGLCRDLCGDGECQEIVCLGAGCPCAESPESCPADCKSAHRVIAQ